MPSAPIASAPRAVLPSANVTVTPSSFCVRLREAPAEPDRVRPLAADGVGERRLQIAAMHEDVRRAVALLRDRAEVEGRPGLAGVPQPRRLAGGEELRRCERVLQAERMQHARAVGADLHAGADLAQLMRLLVDFDLDPAPDQRQRAGEPADAAADDEDVVRHPSSVAK